MRVLVCALAGALLMAAPAGATLTRNPALELYAQQVRGSHVDVWCENSQAAWDANAGPGALGFTSYRGQYTLLAPDECRDLAAPKGSAAFDVAAYILTHELMHTAGIAAEAQAECMNLFMFRYELRRWWGYTKEAAETAWTRGVAAHAGLPAQYQGCVPSADDTVSYANGL